MKTRAIENGFPFEDVSDLAEVESWRKEVYRPVYHLHKWWAQRLGSVFRAAILGAATPADTPLMERFHQPVRLPAPVVFDPFMGSGTTVGEAHKLGCTVIGRDINPVAWRNVSVALSSLSRRRLLDLFEELDAGVGEELRSLYRGRDSFDETCDVLYHFWVKVLPCPGCSATVDLFSSHVFARHAYPARYPKVQVVCPGCGEVFAGHHQDRTADCPGCRLHFDPRSGPASRGRATCTSCGESFVIAKVARSFSRPPEHRLYAKLVLRQDGEKEYLPATEADREAYAEAGLRLRSSRARVPGESICDGYNTRQVLAYGYRRWSEMFNHRQLLALSLLAESISELPACVERDALMLLFSGALEFNNMFASYKGEGTGAVRHMFSHHVLKPERMPIEANVWGTPKSSGSFSTLFRSRLLRALDYKEGPFEVAIDQGPGGKRKGRKVFGLSRPMAATVLDRYPSEGLPSGGVYLSCGDSAATDLPPVSVDLVVTDPPFFDNVHYSELADFFHVWQRLYFAGDETVAAATTRRPEEVQDTKPAAFAAKLRGVFAECHRVLRDEGLLVFSYHHSRDDGWISLVQAVAGAGFTVVAAHPVKAEMSVASPKTQARSPIDLDVLLVCRKREMVMARPIPMDDALERTSLATREKVTRFNRSGRILSGNDVRVVFSSQLLVELSAGRDEGSTTTAFAELLPMVAAQATQIWEAQERVPTRRQEALSAQLSLPS